MKDIDLQYILTSLALTMVFVGFIGYERQIKNKVAGITTHVLVALGACALAIIQEELYVSAYELAMANETIRPNVMFERQRIIAQVVTGVGFLGTGAILKTNGNIHGLTTASTLWISAIVGLIFGLGFYTIGIAVSVCAILTLIIIKHVMGAHN